MPSSPTRRGGTEEELGWVIGGGGGGAGGPKGAQGRRGGCGRLSFYFVSRGEKEYTPSKSDNVSDLSEDKWG